MTHEARLMSGIILITAPTIQYGRPHDSMEFGGFRFCAIVDMGAWTGWSILTRLGCFVPSIILVLSKRD
jgi:hypothetical protein